MIKVIISDFSRVILFPKDGVYQGGLNVLHSRLIQENGNYDFFNFFFLNDDLLHFYESIKSEYTLCVFTESTSIQKVSGIKSRMSEVFQYIYTPSEMGMLKTDPRSYLYIAQNLSRDATEMLFIDDRIANLDAAKKVGVKTIQYFSNDKLFEELGNLGIHKP